MICSNFYGLLRASLQAIVRVFFGRLPSVFGNEAYLLRSRVFSRTSASGRCISECNRGASYSPVFGIKWQHLPCAVCLRGSAGTVYEFGLQKEFKLTSCVIDACRRSDSEDTRATSREGFSTTVNFG